MRTPVEPPDLTVLVDAVAAELWATGQDTPWDDVPALVRHQVAESVLPVVSATVRHLEPYMARREEAARTDDDLRRWADELGKDGS